MIMTIAATRTTARMSVTDTPITVPVEPVAAFSVSVTEYSNKTIIKN